MHTASRRSIQSALRRHVAANKEHGAHAFLPVFVLHLLSACASPVDRVSSYAVEEKEKRNAAEGWTKASAQGSPHLDDSSLGEYSEEKKRLRPSSPRSQAPPRFPCRTSGAVRDAATGARVCFLAAFFAMARVVSVRVKKEKKRGVSSRKKKANCVFFTLHRSKARKKAEPPPKKKRTWTRHLE